jgi:hypothetical protein
MIFFFHRFLRYNEIYHFTTFEDVSVLDGGIIGSGIAKFPEQGESASLMIPKFYKQGSGCDALRAAFSYAPHHHTWQVRAFTELED